MEPRRGHSRSEILKHRAAALVAKSTTEPEINPGVAVNYTLAHSTEGRVTIRNTSETRDRARGINRWLTSWRLTVQPSPENLIFSVVPEPLRPSIEGRLRRDWKTRGRCVCPHLCSYCGNSAATMPRSFSIEHYSDACTATGFIGCPIVTCSTGQSGSGADLRRPICH